MFRRFVRYLPFAFVVWLCRRNSERFIVGSLYVANPFKGEFVGWPIEALRSSEPARGEKTP